MSRTTPFGTRLRAGVRTWDAVAWVPARVALLILCTNVSVAVAEPAVREPDGYRVHDYLAPTPGTLTGATTISAEVAAQMHADGGAVFIDVMPAAPRPPGRTVWNSAKRRSLPGSYWLPNVGRGILAPETQDYFRRHLDRLSSGDSGQALVFFCRRDCWMSWNAAKRAIKYGFRNVYWFPDGATAWEEQGRPMAQIEPVGEVPP